MLQLYLSLLDTQAEKDKFITLYESYRDLMFYVAGRYLGSDADKEIAVDGALHALLGVLDKIDDPQSAKTKNLVCLIVKHKCIDLLRRKADAIEADWESAQDDLSFARKNGGAMPGGPESNSVDSELRTAVLSMSETGREFLILRYYHGYTTAEIADLLGIGRDAARKRLERAKAELKGILEADR